MYRHDVIHTWELSPRLQMLARRTGALHLLPRKPVKRQIHLQHTLRATLDTAVSNKRISDRTRTLFLICLAEQELDMPVRGRGLTLMGILRAAKTGKAKGRIASILGAVDRSALNELLHAFMG